MRIWARFGGAVAILASCVGGRGAAAAQEDRVVDWRIFNVADTNGDRLGDLMWTSASTSRLTVSLMRGDHVLADGSDIVGPPGEGWATVPNADFNADGRADVVWTNARRGTMTIYLLRGTELLAAGPEIQGPPGEGWVAANASDTNADGMADVVWHDASTNRAAVFLMRGSQLLAAGPEIPGPPGEGWEMASASDANADGRGDIIWSNPTRNTMAVWLLDGTRLLAAGPEIPGPPGEGWRAVTASDFNRDGCADMIWTNTARGTMAVSLLRGAQLLATGPEIPGPPGDGWAVVYAGDTNGDELADALWQRAGTTAFAVWRMNGSRLLAAGPVRVGP